MTTQSNSQPRPPALTPGCDRPAVSPRTLPSVETAGRPFPSLPTKAEDDE